MKPGKPIRAWAVFDPRGKIVRRRRKMGEQRYIVDGHTKAQALDLFEDEFFYGRYKTWEEDYEAKGYTVRKVTITEGWDEKE